MLTNELIAELKQEAAQVESEPVYVSADVLRELLAAAEDAERMREALKNLRRYQAVEFADGESGRRIGLAFDGSIAAFEFDDSYQPWELLEMMEKWLHKKIDESITAPAAGGGITERDAARQECERLRELLESAWVIIANVNRGSWNMIPDGSWIKAAEKWRDKYHEATPPAKEASK